MKRGTKSREATTQVLRIEASQGWGSLQLKELWDYRDLIYFLLWREVKGRYRQMALGPLWIVLQPLVDMVIFSLIFGVVAKLPSDGLPYPLFSYSGLLPWNFFMRATSSSANCLLSNAQLISKVYFPRLVVPLVSVLSGLIDFGASLIILLGMMVFYGIQLTPWALTMPLFLALMAATALGVGLWSAALTVYFRDVGFMMGYLLRVWMYATPVAYSTNVIPERWQFLYRLNPTTGAIEGFRWALLGVGEPPRLAVLISTVFVLVLLVTGAYFFRRTERTIVDVV
ncbi:ABC transporter permease [Leptolyngbya sp. FACHB-261]|nr:ABC transporter permease [Leptolyngbya sp. FACHB-261]